MQKKLLVLAVITLFSLPTYAAAQCCCCSGKAEAKPSQSQNPVAKDQSSNPAPMAASGGSSCPFKEAASKQKTQDQVVTQKPETSGTEKN
jgi:hypothetical protein